MPVRLETERLLLREFRAADVPAYAPMLADPDVMRYMGEGKTFTADEAWRAVAGMLGHWRLLGYGMWALEEKGSGALVGRAGFLDPPGWPGFELGWMLGKPYWRRGYATEAAARCLRYAFEELGLNRVEFHCASGNSRSRSFPERSGFAHEGTLRQAQWLGDRFVDLELYSLLAHEWRGRK
jgi:RimJ/RimL family protein N-acetyltransferase